MIRAELPPTAVMVDQALAVCAPTPRGEIMADHPAHVSRQPCGWQPLAVRWEDVPPDPQNFGRTGHQQLDVPTGRAAAGQEPRDTFGGHHGMGQAAGWTIWFP